MTLCLFFFFFPVREKKITYVVEGFLVNWLYHVTCEFLDDGPG